MTAVYTIFILLLCFFGAIIMSLEILSANLMAPYFGGSIYTWGSIISSFMLHMSIGYFLGGYLARRTKKLSHLFILLMISSLWIICIPLINRPVSAFVSNIIMDVRSGTLLVMTTLFLLPILIMAMISPYIIGILFEYDHQTRFNAGLVLFVSTLGSFFGTNLTAFYLINLFTISDIITFLGATGFILSGTALIFNLDNRLKTFEIKLKISGPGSGVGPG